MPRSFDIEVPRQGDWPKELVLTDIDGAPINLTGATVEWKSRAIAGAGAVLAAATVNIVEPLSGRISARWHGPDFDAFGLPTEAVRVAHDLKLTYPTGIVDVLLRGQLIIYPEVTV
ncbi:hypothetical protein ABIC65_001101 [Sphingomonas trueperi]|uniref:hypothetical protein n=1 Tax=Sphingomonas trueperi TaxID=53317 RepID=UPI003395DDA0